MNKKGTTFLKTTKSPLNWIPSRFASAMMGVVLTASILSVPAQGTITFINGGTTQNYYEGGMGFHVVAPTNQPLMLEVMVLIRAGISSHPTNGTPHMEFDRSYLTQSNYVVFSLTSGSLFGLTSVDLADTFAPSSTPVSITFNGILADNSVVTTTFTTAGGGSATFQNFLFGAAFASGLVRVEIPSAVWAMDNLVFGNVTPVPEPGTVSLIAVGLLAFAMRRIKTRS